MNDFTYEALPMRVVFGAGSRNRLAQEVDALGLSRVLVLCTPEQQELAEEISAWLGERSVGVFAGAQMHVPIEIAQTALDKATNLDAQGCVAVGGGSTVGLGKAIALTFGLPVIAVPTTYAGSEMTPVWGLTEAGVKTTGKDPKVLPTSVVYDPELTYTLPVEMTVTSAFNAVAHAVEGLYAPDASPIIALMAAEGVRAMVSALPRIVAEPADPDARAEALRAAWLCVATLGATTMSLHHKLCHVLGGTFNLPHAQTHTIVLPYVLEFNAAEAPGAFEALKAATGSDDPAARLQELARELGAPTSLAQLGMPEDGIAEVVRQAIGIPYANPREVTAEALTDLLSRAHTGTPLR